MKRVYWGDYETEKLISIVASMRLNDVSSSILQLLEKAQQQLPEDKRRTIPGIHLVPWLVSGVAKKMQQLKEQATKTEKPALAIPPLPPPPRPQEILDAMSMEEMYLVIAKKVFDKIEHIGYNFAKRLNRLENLIMSAIQQGSPVANSTTSTSIKEKKLRVMIVGLLPGQTREVEAKCEEHAQLIFIDKRRADRGTAKGFPVADYAIVSKFVSHKLYENVKKVQLDGHTFFADGGIGGIVKKIFDLTSRQ